MELLPLIVMVMKNIKTPIRLSRINFAILEPLLALLVINNTSYNIFTGKPPF